MLELDSISRAAGWQEVSGFVFFLFFFFSALWQEAGRAGLKMIQHPPQQPPAPPRGTRWDPLY